MRRQCIFIKIYCAFLLSSLLFLNACSKSGSTESSASTTDSPQSIQMASPDTNATDTQWLEKLIPLHEVKLPPGPNDWMAVNREPDQSLFEYMRSNPIRPDTKRKAIYFILIGEFDQKRKLIVEQTARFTETYFQLPVKWLEPLREDSIPKHARRVHPQTQDKQILTTYILEEVLPKVLPADAVNLIAFTHEDLWPGEGWNFVFGQASIEDRVGVWSTYRNGNPFGGPDEEKMCLIRTMKTATHEIGHMFSMHHCPYYECNMNGSNHRLESDRRPLWLCPVCLGKLQYAIGFDAKARFKDLREISSQMRISDLEAFYQKSESVIK